MLIYTNGSWVDAEQAVVPYYDQGFLYGDSLFETIRINRGQPFRLEKHLERLERGMATIRMDGAVKLIQIPPLIDEFIQRNALSHGLVRLIITRGVSSGSPWSMQSELAIYISAREIKEVRDWPVKILFLEEKNYPILRFYPAIKSSNYLGNMLAKKDAEEAGAFEPVFVNRDGFVTECAIRNVFFIKDNDLLTPSLELGVLPGVIRDTIMELAAIRGMKVRETFIFKDDVMEMDEAFISSSGVGVLPVYWDGFMSSNQKCQVLREDLIKLFESGATDVS